MKIRVVLFDIAWGHQAGREPSAFGPFKSEAEARNAVREMQRDSPTLFRPGTYRIERRPGSTTAESPEAAAAAGYTVLP